MTQELEQERFSLQQRLECQKAALQAVQHEADSARTELQQEFEMREEHLKQVSTSTVYREILGIHISENLWMSVCVSCIYVEISFPVVKVSFILHLNLHNSVS